MLVEVKVPVLAESVPDATLLDWYKQVGERVERARSLLHLVHLDGMEERRPSALSGGQQQQLAIARALITRPKLLLLDEPTEGIQPNIIQQIGEVIKLLRDKGDMAIVLVEQYFEFAYDLADRFVVLRRGEVLMAGDKSSMPKNTLLEGVSV